MMIYHLLSIRRREIFCANVNSNFPARLNVCNYLQYTLAVFQLYISQKHNKNTNVIPVTFPFQLLEIQYLHVMKINMLELTRPNN